MIYRLETCAYAVYTGEDKVNRFLGKVVKRFNLRNNIAKQRVIFLNLRLLVGLHGVTKEALFQARRSNQP